MRRARAALVAMAALVSGLAGCGGGDDDGGPDCSRDPCGPQTTPGPGPGQVTLSWRPLDDAETPWFAHSYSVYLASRSWVNQLTYTICLDGEALMGMIAGRCARPFSLDQKLPDLDRYLPPHRRVVEVRLLAVKWAHRKFKRHPAALFALPAGLIAVPAMRHSRARPARGERTTA